MKQTGKKIFWTTTGLCARICRVTAHVGFILPPSQTALIHIRSRGLGEEKKTNLCFGVQNHIWQNTEANHLQLYTYAHLLYILYSTHNMFSFVHPSVYTRVTLKKRNQRQTFLSLTAEQMYHR